MKFESEHDMELIVFVKTIEDKIIYLQNCDNVNYVRFDEIIDAQNFDCSKDKNRKKEPSRLLEDDILTLKDGVYKEISEVMFQVRNKTQKTQEFKVICKEMQY